MARCNTCLLVKNREAFHKSSASPHGLDYRCKSCKSQAYKKRRKKAISYQIELWPNYNKQELYCSMCKSMVDANLFHKSSKTTTGHQTACRTCKNASNRKKKRWRKEKYKEQSNKWKRQSYKKKYKKDAMYTAKVRLRGILGQAYRQRGYGKSTKTAKILGETWDVVYLHLKHSFEENYGLPFQPELWSQVHIDHVIPLATAQTESDLIKLNHYKNLQLLFWWENLEKADKIPEELKSLADASNA